MDIFYLVQNPTAEQFEQAKQTAETAIWNLAGDTAILSPKDFSATEFFSGYGYDVEEINRFIYSKHFTEDAELIEEQHAQNVAQDIVFGKSVIEAFLTENRIFEPRISNEESLQLLTTFNSIQMLLTLGSIKDAYVILQGAGTIPRVFEQERIDRYVAKLNDYISKYYP